jgi:hypothetical protein
MTIAISNDRNSESRIQFLDDYCPRCNPLGYHADSRVRLASLTEPTSVTWPRGKHAICAYHCGGCGHDWQRTDLWTAECAGFDRKQRKAT